MLKVYAATWCPHCRNTVAFLEKHYVPFEYIDMEKTDPATEAKVIEVNGGDDWVVPTLENNGLWRAGKAYDPLTIAQDLRELGVSVNE